MFFLGGTNHAQNNTCDCSQLRRLSELYQDTSNVVDKIIDDPEDENFGLSLDTTRVMALMIIRENYFFSCLKGKRKRHIKKILGSDYKLNYDDGESESNYYFQMFYSGFCKGLCGYAAIQFNKRGRAIGMSIKLI